MFQAQGAESNQRPPPLPPAQKAICYNSDGLTKPEMDAASQNLYHPKGKCLLNHREPEESGGRGQGHRDAPKGRTVEEGAPGPGLPPTTAPATTPTLGESQMEGKKPGHFSTPTFAGCAFTRTYVSQAHKTTHKCACEYTIQTHTHTNATLPPIPMS